MHLAIRVPNTWYRARARVARPDDEPASRTVSASTLPGVPRSSPAATPTWRGASPTPTPTGATSSCSRSTRRIRPGTARRRDGARSSSSTRSSRSPASPDEHVTSRWTIWGPVLGADHRGRLRAYRWVAHAADRLAGVDHAARARSHASRKRSTRPTALGAPGQNMVVADRSRPHRLDASTARSRDRVGIDGRLPASWADGSRGWNGWLDRRGVPAHHRSAGRPHLDRERPRGRRRDAGAAGRRQLRSRLAGAR